MLKGRASKRAGLTLIEMTLVLSLTALVIGVLTALYGFSMERLAHATADFAATDDAFLATDAIASTVKDANSCAAVAVNGVTALKCTMPASGTDKDGDGWLDSYNVSTVSRRGYEQVGLGMRRWFYLSDSTGAIGNAGTVLWRAQRSDDLNPTTSDIDHKFAYISGTNLRYPMITALSFSVNSSNQTVTVTLSAGSLTRAARTPGSEASNQSYTVTQTRTAFWRDWRK